MQSRMSKLFLWLASIVLFLVVCPLDPTAFYCEAFSASIAAATTRGQRQSRQQQRQWREQRPRMTVLSRPPVDNNNVDDDSNGDTTVVDVQMMIQSPVLKHVYPLMIEYVQTYGHPNIPLKTPGGRQCVTLRRLYTQQKLMDSDVRILDALNFTWHSFEDTYTNNKDRFDEFVQRLQNYGSDLSPPKKYAPDPELGAWVTGIRRLYTVPGAVDPRHVQVLTDMGFSFSSPRKCGSSFMKTYRTIVQQQQQEEDSTTSSRKWHENPEVIAFIRAQQQRAKELSPTRQHYMEQLLGPDWQHWKPTTTTTHNQENPPELSS